MKRWFMAAAFVLTSAGFASADYVIIVANVGSSKELRTIPGMGMAGRPGMGMAGMQGAGMQGRFPGMPPGGSAPGGAPAPGGGPAPGAMPPGVVPPNMANKGAGGGAVGMGGMPPGMGGMPPGMGGAMGAAGMGGMMGMAGMRGGPGAGMMGMRGGSGGMMGMPGGMPEPADVDDVPYFIISIVEVDPGQRANLVNKLKNGLATVKLTDRLGKDYQGKSIKLHPKPSFGEVIVLTQDKEKALPTVHEQFKTKYTAIMKEKPSTDDIVGLAEWALSHGLIEEVPSILDKLVENDNKHRAAVAYLKVKAELNRPATGDDAALGQVRKLLGDYKQISSPHYTLVHNIRANGAKDVQSHLDQLENTFRGYYYWFALKGAALPVPKQRQIIVLTGSNDDFKRSRKVLTSGPVVVDGFFARRENTAVMASKRQDDSFDALLKYYQVYEDKGLHRSEALLEKVPSSVLKTVTPDKVIEGQMLALMLRAMEKESELATISHDASRQLLFASGLLPRNVSVPEWVLFGMGSFFETPLQSPWPSLAGPSAYYLPRWNEMKGKELKSPSQTLRQVITDGLFRAIPPEGKSGSEERHAHDSAVRRARTAAWSLTYFLASSKTQFPRLQNYFKELSKLPRDIELDDEVLLNCFARAFGLVDRNNKVDNGKLDALAREWYSSMEQVHFDSEGVMKKIRDVFRDKLKQMQEQAGGKNDQGQVDPKTGKPIQPGGFPPNGPGRFPPQGPGPGGFQPPNPGGGNR